MDSPGGQPTDAASNGVSASRPRPKQRRLRACDSCRQRKIRCDSIPGSCRNCEVYGEQCVISRNGAFFRRVQQGQPGQRTKQRIAHGSVADTASTTAASLGASTGSPASAISAPIEELEVAEMLEGIPVAMSNMQEQNDSELVQAVVTTEVGHSPSNAKFAGLSSPQVLARVAQQVFSRFSQMNVMDFFCPMMTFAEEFPLATPTQCPLLTQEMADECVQHYFTTYHFLFPVLDEAAFRQSYQSFYGADAAALNTAQIACILLVIALGATSTEIFDSHLKAAFDLYNSLIARPYLSSVQAFILMTLCFLDAGKDGQAVLCIAFASQMAQSIGLHRSLFIYRHPREIAFVLKDHDLRNRIWWTCYCLDKKLSFEGGQLSAIHDDDCDAELPQTGPASPSSIAGPNGGSRFVFLSAFINLAKILSNISRSLFHKDVSRVSNDELVRRIAAADRDLLLWRDSLPEELQPDRELYALGNDVLETGSGMLHCIYYNAFVVIHRASLVSTAGKVHLMKTHANRRIAASDVVCLSAARSLVRSVNHLVIECRSFRMLGLIHPYAINAVMTLYIGIMQSPLRWSAPTDLALMRSMQQCFEQSRDPAAGSRFKSLMASLTEAMEKSEAAARQQTPSERSSTLHGREQVAPPRSQASAQSIAPWPLTDQIRNVASGGFSSVNTTSLTGTHLDLSSRSNQQDNSSDNWMVTPTPSQSCSTPSLFSDARSIALPVDVEGLQLGDFFGDHSTAWNTQLWPLLGDGSGGKDGVDPSLS